MQPIFRVTAAAVDITDAIADRLLELVVIDEAGTQSDQMRLVLDDRRRADGGIAQLPKIGTSLEVEITYLGQPWVKLGKFIIDELELSAPPATLTVSGKAADMVGPFRTPKTRSWHETTLGRIVRDIATSHRYQPRIDPALGNIPMAHLDQTEESDMALLTRLANQYDAVAKPVNGYLVLAKRGAAKSVSGIDLPVITLAEDDLAEWRYRHSARAVAGTAAGVAAQAQTPTGGTKAYWWDFARGERREVTTGRPPFEEIRYVHATEAEAKAAAAGKKNKGERGQGELSFSLPGDPRLAAEGRLTLNLRPGISTDWRIKRVEHRLGNQGFITQVECERSAANPEAVL